MRFVNRVARSVHRTLFSLLHCTHIRFGIFFFPQSKYCFCSCVYMWPSQGITAQFLASFSISNMFIHSLIGNACAYESGNRISVSAHNQLVDMLTSYSAHLFAARKPFAVRWVHMVFLVVSSMQLHNCFCSEE